MSFKDLNFKISYNSDQDDILNNFYIPALSESVLYKRIGGFFSSSSFALSARGLTKFIAQEGKIEMIVNYLLQEKDKEMIEKITTDSEFLSNLLNENISSWNLENEAINNHVKVFGWLLAKKRLDLKIAITTQPEIFHQKIGIMHDREGNKISFSGSNNETSLGWKSNIEEFKVFKGWVEEQNKYLIEDEKNFDNFWKGGASRFIVIDLPTAVREKLIQLAPKSIDNIKIDDGEMEKALFSKDEDLQKNTRIQKPVELYDFQLDAIKGWVKNGYSGIFEMATGTGKTFTALGAAKNVIDKLNGLCLIVAVPYKHLATQWTEEIKEFFPEMITVAAHSESEGWTKKASDFLSDYRDGYINSFAIVISYDTLASDRFNQLFIKKINPDKPYMLIADEVHNIGSRKRMRGMIKEIRLRLGLSATPTRWFDEEGTDEIIKYFGKTVFEYNLKQAIENGFLTHYDYHPIFVKMSDEEMGEYLEFTQKIIKNFRSTTNDNSDTYLKLLLIQRSKILKNIKSKMSKFEDLIKKMKSNKEVEHLLIYCDAGDQLSIVQEIINKYGIINHKFTQEEPNEERRKILNNFDNGIYSCLVAIKCLDEGVNVPSTKTAIILASTKNPREYIQRRGRVLRRVKGQEKKAVIYDFTVLPPDNMNQKNITNIERNIFKNELSRIQDFLNTADNKAEILSELNEIMVKFGVYLTE